MCSGGGPAHGASWRRVAEGEAPAITTEYVASLRVVEVYPQALVQPGAKFIRTEVRGIPFVVRGRTSTVVRAMPPLSAEYWIVTDLNPAQGTRWSLVGDLGMCGLLFLHAHRIKRAGF